MDQDQVIRRGILRALSVYDSLTFGGLSVILDACCLIEELERPTAGQVSNQLHFYTSNQTILFQNGKYQIR